ncbi:MAG: DUF488 family protein [Thaumarchaeota archaeon]|nr:DUF488 family protein [Nitrososphaerota archaeon]
MILTKSIYDIESDDDGLRVLVTRFWPRGVKKDRISVWIRDLAPSAQLLKSYKDGRVSWPTFVGFFKNELQDNQNARETIEYLKVRARNSSVTLLCYEREGPCHRFVLKEMIEQL